MCFCIRWVDALLTRQRESYVGSAQKASKTNGLKMLKHWFLGMELFDLDMPLM